MSFIDEWQARLDDSYAKFAKIAANTQDIDFNWGIISAAILWPVRDDLGNDDNDDAIDALEDICGRKARAIDKAIYRWSDDHLEDAARTLAEQAKDNEKLQAGLDLLIDHFEAKTAFSKHLLPLLPAQKDGTTFDIEQIKAALVNVGGITNIQSLNNHIDTFVVNYQAPPPKKSDPPPKPMELPEVPGFIGRATELAYFSEKLINSHLAVVSGLVGVGKTYLSATLARQQNIDPNKIFWCEFARGDGADAMIGKLAAFLAWHKHNSDVWEMIEQTRINNSAPHPPAELFRYLFEQIRGKGFLLCLDNFHYISDDPAIHHLVDEIRSCVLQDELSIIISTQGIPDFVQVVEFETLKGLSIADTKTMLAERNVTLSEELVIQLHRWTEGNAQLLDMAITIIQNSAEAPDQIIAQLKVARDVARFLRDNINDHLSEPERQLMIAVAVLMENPGTRDAIARIADQQMIKDQLGRLSEQHLLVEHKENSIKYSEHTSLQAYFYDMPETEFRREMHQRAGEYYENEVNEQDWLLAAQHYLEAQSYQNAAKLITDDVRLLINKGQARPLRTLLERLIERKQQLDLETQILILIAHGEICSFLSDMEPARTSYELARDILIDLSDRTPEEKMRKIYERTAQIYLGLAEMVRYESPQEALDWLQKGLAEVAQVPVKERRQIRLTEAGLHITSGAVLYFMSEFDSTEQSLNQGLSLLEKKYSQLKAIALKNLGNCHDDQGKIESATQYWQEALDISKQIGDSFQVVSIQGNMGIGKEVAGHWAEAAEDYTEALQMAEQLGSAREQMKLNNLLAILSTNRGDDEAAHQHFTKALQLARDYNLDLSLPYILPSLATLHIRTQNWKEAKKALIEAEEVGKEADTKYQLAEIYYLWAQVHLGNNEIEKALTYVEDSLALTRELELDLEEGIALGILGQVQLANKQPAEAVTTFEQSLDLLAGRDPYQAARTKTAWGRYLISDSDSAKGYQLLEEAQTKFQELGADRDLEEVNPLLKKP